MKKLADYQVNDKLPQQIWYPSQLQLRQYAEASGDFNPIHLDERYAKQVGLEGVIAHGMLIMAQLGALLTNWLKDQASIDRFEVRFKSMVRLGEPIICSGYVKEKLHNGCICCIMATNGKGEEVLSGSAEIKLRA
jgi:acyl dehydratase